MRDSPVASDPAALRRFLAARWLLPNLAVLLLLGLSAWMLHVRPVFDSSAERLLATDPRNQDTFDQVSALMPDTTLVLVVLEPEEIFSNAGAALIAEMSDALLALPGAVEVKSLTHSGRPVRRGLQLWIDPFIPEWAPESEWQELAAFATRFPLSRNVLVSACGRFTVLLPVFHRELPDLAARAAFREELRQTLAPFDAALRSRHLLAFPFLEVEAVEIVQRDLRRGLAFAALLIIAILLLAFRSPLWVALVLSLQAIGLTVTALLFPLLGLTIDLHSAIAFPLVSGVQLTFVVHLMAALQRAGRHLPPRGALAAATRETVRPAAIAALTTLAGLLTLAVSDNPLTAQFGQAAAVGISAAFAITFAFPLWLSRQEPHSAAAPAATLQLHPPPGWTRWAFLGLTLALLPGIPRIRTDLRAVEFLPPRHPSRLGIERLDRDFGGIQVFQLEVDSGRPGGMHRREILQFLETLRHEVAALDNVSEAYAFSQLYVALHQIWEGRDSAEGSLPQSPLVLNFLRQILQQTPVLFQEAFLSEDQSRSRFLVRTRDMPAADYLALLDDIQTIAAAIRPEGVRLNPLQGYHDFLAQEQRLVQTQLRSLWGSALLIALLLTLLWRNFRMTLWIFLANVPALTALFAAMGYADLPLNSVTVLLAAVLLGIAVDDGIHWMAAFRARRLEGYAPPEAARLALREKARPMVCTTAILMVCFGLLSLSGFPPVSHFGLLAMGGLLLSLLGALGLLPALAGKPQRGGATKSSGRARQSPITPAN